MKIIFATDGSEYAEGAAEFLKNFKFSINDEIIILYVISIVPFKDDRASYYASLQNIKQQIAPKILDSAVNKLKDINAKISTALLDGYPDKLIIDAAVNTDADLIIIGARGLKGLKSLFLGSVTRSVAAKSPKSILVIKPSTKNIKEGLKILYATDGSDYAIKAAEFLTKIPFPENTEVTILNVIPTSYIDVPERYWLEVNDRVKQEVAMIREKEFEVSNRIIKDAKNILDKKFKKIDFSLKFGDPSEEILLASKELNTDIIAVGSSGIRGIKGMLGSVSRNIIMHSECSVLISK